VDPRMTIRLWYQSLSRDGAWTPYREALQRQLDRFKDPGTEIHIAGTTRLGGVAEQFRYLEFLATAEVLENCQRAVREGYDAFLIGNFSEPGLIQAREIANIPVLGLSETSMLTACMTSPVS
jgi:allantoin racemase